MSGGAAADIRNRVAGAVARGAVERIRSGRLELEEAGRRHTVGDDDGRGEGRAGRDSGTRGDGAAVGGARAGLSATVRIHDSLAWSRLARGSVGLGEGYVDGLWDTDDLLAVLRIAARELARFDTTRTRLRRSRGLWHRLRGLVPRNTRTGARENIAAHYDLGNDLFETFLDQRMQYSCAIFPNPGASLEEAQLTKLDRICTTLELHPGDHLLEIGTGWGGLAIHAAGEYGCRVTTTTISQEQRELAARRVEAAGLADRVTILGTDYRDLRGEHSKLVSVEMIEAVGWQYLDRFLAQCSRLLAGDGLMLLQAITVPDHRYEAEKDLRTFANTHVFPGGCLPSLGAIEAGLRRSTELRQVAVEHIGEHYAPTLAAWRERFQAGWDRLGPAYDERFRRLWTFYLTYCEAGFIERRIDDVQLLLAKPGAQAEPEPRRGGAPLPAPGKG